MIRTLLSFSFLLVPSLMCAKSIYVSPTGNDASGSGIQSAPYASIQKGVNQAVAGDTVLVEPGTYKNTGYGSGATDNGSVVSLWNVAGANGAPIVIRSSEKHGAKIQFDGAGGFVGGGLSYIRIEDFEIEGSGADIPIDSAIAHRLDLPTLPYYSGRGIAFWGGSSGSNHHIIIRGNRVHHAPNSGIRVNYGDYLLFEDNEVFSNCWKSPNAESAIVTAILTSIDTKDSAKVVFRRNKVWNNGNFVIYYNSTYGSGSDYGQPGYTQIIDGQGLYTTRSNGTWTSGWVLFENNLAVNNGINGIVCHQTPRCIVRNNTLYMNGQYPEGIARSGITANGSDQVEIYHNIILGRNNVVLENFDATNVSVYENLIWQGTSSYGSSSYTEGDPLFVSPGLDPDIADFSLTAISPAVDAATTSSSIEQDIDENLRPSGLALDFGAYEFQTDPTTFIPKTAVQAIQDWEIMSKNKSTFFVPLIQGSFELEIFNTQGQVLKQSVANKAFELNTILSKGIYLLRVRHAENWQSMILKL